MKIFCNFKNFLVGEELDFYLKKIDEIDNSKVVFFPSYVDLKDFSRKGLTLGVQDYAHLSATGEVDYEKLLKFNLKYAIIGHSERRRLLKESNLEISLKVKKAIKDGIIPVICIGESDHECIEEELALQLDFLKDVEGKYILAYEPEYAIGASEAADYRAVNNSIKYIKKVVGGDVEVLYGGSVNESSISVFVENDVCDGFLVGRASANIDKLKIMINKI